MQFCFLFLLLVSTLFSIAPSTPDEVANLGAQPSSIVGGYINVITGDFVYRRSDLTIPGAADLTIDRFFSSREKKELGQKWEPFCHHRATKSDGRIYIQEASGIAIPYIKVAKGLYRPDESFFANGVPIDSLHNPKLNRATYNGKKLTVFQSDGTTRIFRPYWYCEQKYRGNSIEFVLVRETHRDGHMQHYKWEIEKSIFPLPEYSQRRERFLKLQKVFVTSPDRTTEYGCAGYTYSGSKVSVQGSNGKTLTYETSRRDKSTIGFIERVTSSDHPRCTHKWDKQKLKKFILPEGRNIQLSYDGHKVSRLSLPEGLKYEFEYYDTWTNVIHPNGAQSTYYHSKHRLDKIVHYGHGQLPIKTETFSWTKEGKLLKKEILDETDTPLFTIENRYDDQLNLIWQKRESLITEYAYDTLHRLTKEKVSTGKETSYRYLSETHLPERLERKDGAIVKRTRYQYDDNFLLVSEVIDDCGKQSYTKNITRNKRGMVEWIDTLPNGELVTKNELLYNKYGDIETCKTYDANGTYCHETRSIYNENGLLVEQIDPAGNKTKVSYDKNRNPIKEKKPNGLKVIRTYDTLGRLQTEEKIGDNESQKTEYKYHKSTKPSWIIDHVGDRVHNLYDSFDHLIATTLPGGAKTTYTFNALGHITSKTDPRGYTTTITPNHFGDPLEILYPDGTSETYTYTTDRKLLTHTDQIGTQTELTYDPYGHVALETLYVREGAELCRQEQTHTLFQLLEEVDTGGYTTHYTYNNRSQLIEKTRAGTTTAYTYTPLGRLETETCDGETRRYAYDRLGHQTLMEEYANGQLLTKIETTYNPSGNPTQITRYPNNTPATSRIIYDPFDRPIAKIDALGNRTTFTYTQNTTTTTFPGGIVTVETQNAYGNPVHYCKYDKDTLIEEKRYTYDKAQNLIHEETGPHTTTYTYDCMGRKETQIESNLRTSTYAYTEIGELASVKKPDGTLLTYTYDALRNLCHLTSSKGDIDYSYVHNTFGELLISRDHIKNTQTERTLDPNGHILEEHLANGSTTRYTYTPSGKRKSMTLPNGREVTYSYKGRYLHTINYQNHTHTYTYDLAGNPTEETAINGSIITRTYDPLCRPQSLYSNHLSQACIYTNRGNIASISLDGQIKTYNYDSLDRLIQEPENTYSYDRLYNRVSHNQTTYTHNTLNEIDGYIYDANGNLIDDGETTYAYDSLDRLIQIDNETYRYDAQHRRLDLLWDKDKEIGTLKELRILDPTHPAEYAVAILTPKEILLPVHDLQHNLVKVFTLQNELLALHTLTAFGELKRPSEIPWTFCAKRATHKLLYFGRRYYNPKDGRFITPDPIGYTDTANLYIYSLNNPLIYFDPKGLQTDTIAPSSYNYYQSNYGSIGAFQPGSGFNQAIQNLNSLPAYLANHGWTRSDFFQVGSFDLPHGSIGFINGINNQQAQSIASAQQLSQYAGGAKVYGVYNATNWDSNRWVSTAIDVLECRLGHMGMHTPPVQLLKNQWNHFIATHGAEEKFLQFSHSGGGLHVFNALLTSPRSVQRRIISVALAPAAVIPEELCFKSYNYISRRDFVTHLDVIGKMKYGNQLQILEPHPDANFWDHEFLSPTFAQPIQYHITNYLKDYGGNK